MQISQLNLVWSPEQKGKKQTDIYEREASSSLASKVVLPEIEVKRQVKFFPIRKGKQKKKILSC